ncbi:MAG: hypothetical protein WCA84_09935 [Ignavibacteriaceae bacterium]
MYENLSKVFKLKFILLFILAAYFSYLFHEFGHWTIGEILGNKMVLNLNYTWPKSGYYIKSGDELYTLIGGPGFSILQAVAGLLIIMKYKNFYVYPFVFFPMYTRFFSLSLGGFGKEDEARVSAMIGGGNYTFAILVVLILIFLVIKSCFILKIDFRKNSYIFVLSTLCQVLVIGTYQLMSILKL